jgi:DNA repair exonuclease SbcCD ATPase subunit
MLISRILLKNFGKFENFECDFTPGLNLIKGPNEAGKSTLANAITAALFLNPAEGSKELVGAMRWRSKELPALEAVFEVDGGTARLVKDFMHGRMELNDTRTGMTSGESRFIEQWLADQLGISSEDIFKATACVNQGRIDRIEESFEAIKDKLESLITGGREDQAASQTIAKIDSRLAEIGGGDGASGGRLEELGRQADEMNFSVERLNKAIAGFKAKRADLIQVEMAYSNVCDDLQAKKENFESSKKAVHLEEMYTRASREYNDLVTKINEAAEALKKIKGLRDRGAELKKVETKELRELEAVESSLLYLRPKHNELETERNEAKNEYSAFKVGQGFSVCIVIGFLGTALSIISALNVSLGIIKPWATYGILMSAFLAVFGIAMVATRTKHRKYLKKRFEKLEEKLTELDGTLSAQNAQLKKYMAKYSAGSLDELKRSLWQHDDLEKQIAREKELYDSIVGDVAQQDLERRRDSLEEALEKLKRDKRDLSQHIIAESELARQGQVISQYEDRLRDLERERLVLRQQIETAEGGAELLASFVERRDHLRNEAEKLQHEAAILRLTKDCVNEARQDVLVSTLEVLNARTSDILHKLTSGRYSRVRFDKVTMKFEIFSDDCGQWVQPEAGLSAGTLDQVYLAARLALADIVSDQKNPPVILDDPFAGYDEKRLENAMRVVKELSANHQVLLLTSHGEYDRWADSTIAL